MTLTRPPVVGPARARPRRFGVSPFALRLRQPPPAPPAAVGDPAHDQHASPGTPPQVRGAGLPRALERSPTPSAAAKLMGEVLWDDLDFEREFYMIPRDTYALDSPPRDRSRTCPSIAGGSSAPTGS